MKINNRKCNCYETFKCVCPTGLLYIGLGALVMSAQVLEAKKLDALEEVLSIEEYGSADSLSLSFSLYRLRTGW